MAKIEYTVANGKGISGEFGNGSPDGIFCAGAFISDPDVPEYQGINSDEWVPNGPSHKRRFFGSDWGNFTYTYSAGFKLPAGSDFKVKLTLKGVNQYGTDPAGPHTLRYGYTTTKYEAGTINSPGQEPTLGYLNSPSGLNGIKDFQIGPANKYHYGTTVIETILPNNYSEQTVYFFFWGKDAKTTWSLWSFASLELEIEYTEYTKVGPSSIESIDSLIIKPYSDFSVIINPGEDGVNNPVIGYRFYFSTNENVTLTSPYVDKGLPDDDNKITLSYRDLGSPSRGSIIRLGILTRSKETGYDSELSFNNNNFVKINSLPSQPKVIMQESTVPKNGLNYNVVVESISSVDADSQDISYWFSVSKESSLKEEWFQLPDDKTISCNNSNKKLWFKAYDGLEYSEAIFITLTENTGPVNFNFRLIQGEGFHGYTGFNYTQKLRAEATGSLEYTYQWFYKYEEGENFLSLGTGQNLNNISISPGQGPIQIKLLVSDKYSDQSEIIRTTNIRYANVFSEDDTRITLYNLKNQQNNLNVAQFSREMSANIYFNKPTKDQVFVQKIRASIKNSENSEEIAYYELQKNFMSTDSSSEHKINFLIDKRKTWNLGNCTLEIQLLTTNSLGKELLIYSERKEIEFIPLFSDVFNIKEISTNLNLKENFSQSVVVNGGIPFYQINDMLVFVESPVSNIKENISDFIDFTPGIDLASSMLTFTSPRDIFQKIKLPSNQDYSLKAYVFPVNVLGESAVDLQNFDDYISSKNTIIINFKVLFNSVFAGINGSAPYMLPHISYSYLKDENKIYPNWQNLEITDKERMINYDEYLYFNNYYTIEMQMNLFYDGSGEQPREREPKYVYTLEYSKLDSQNSPIAWNSIENWQNLQTFENLLKFEINTLNGEKIVFRLRAKDEFNLPVLNPNGEEWLITDLEKYLIGCRKEQPKIVISNCYLKDSNFFATLKINDYGGNNLGYENFNRNIGENSTISGAEGTYKITWRCGETANSLIDIDEQKNNRISALSLDTGELPHESVELNLGRLNDLIGHIYLEIEVYFYYNINGDYVSVKTPIYIIYTESPTVSYRYHRLGINIDADTLDDENNKIYDEDILTIGDFQNKRYVRLKGEYIDEDLTEIIAREVIIDLKTGTVSGLMISGGTW